MKTEVDLAGIVMKNPVMTASGTFGYGKEYSEFYDLSLLGAVVPKTSTLDPRPGNPPPRLTETPSGMINSIGLQNRGIDYFIENDLPFLKRYSTPIIANISECNVEDYVEAAKMLSVDGIAGLEVNVSCPNVKCGGMVFGTDAKATYDVTQAVKGSTFLPVIVKLTPNVTDITKIAAAAYDAGADALSMINTLLGMSINVETRKPKIHGNNKYMGGLSGPCIKPVGVRCVYQVYGSGIPLPIVGIGGIMDGDDAIEYILAGATAVGVGTASFIDPSAPVKVIKGIESYMKKHGIDDIYELRGKIDSI